MVKRQDFIKREGLKGPPFRPSLLMKFVIAIRFSTFRYLCNTVDKWTESTPSPIDSLNLVIERIRAGARVT